MNKWKYRVAIAIRAVIFGPALSIWFSAGLISEKLEEACWWLSDKLPDPNKWR